MSEHYEMQKDGGNVGWLGWRVTIGCPGLPDCTYAFDERDGVESAAAAVRLALSDDRAGERAEMGSLDIRIVETRTIISSEINPN